MPGWTTGDNFHNNIGYTPGGVDRVAPHLREAWSRRPVPHSLRPLPRHPHGPRHAFALSILEGRRLRVSDRRLPRKRTGCRFEGCIRLGLRRPDTGARRLGKGQAFRESCRSSQRVEEAGRAVRARTPGNRTSRPIGLPAERTVDWLDHQLAARELLPLDPANTHLIVEHEYPRARIQDREKLMPILKGSIAFTRQNRSGGGVHVCPAARGSRGTEDSRTRDRATGLPLLTLPLARFPSVWKSH